MDVVVVGAGIGGLAAAIGARRAGHRVTVIEQSSHLGEVGAGVGMAPNATAALRRLGVSSHLSEAAVEAPSWQRRRWDDGAVVAEIPLGQRAVDHFGSPFWTVHRGDLHSALHQVAAGEGPGEPVNIQLSQAVTDVDAGRGRVMTATGSIYEGDLIIGADGVRSRIRANLFDSSEALYSGNVAYRVQLTRSQLLADPELAAFAGSRSLQTWMGPGSHLLIMTLRGGQMLNCTICVSSERLADGTWSAPAEKEEVLTHLVGWHPGLIRLVDSAPSAHRWDLYDREPLPTWKRGRVALLGDAAHPMLPYLGQGAAQALEDAALLGDLLVDARPDNVDDALALYENRIDRASAVQTGSRANRDLFHLPDGPEQTARDDQMARDSRNLTTFDWLWRGYTQPALSTP